MHPRLVLASVVTPVLVLAVALAGGRWVAGEAGDTRSSLTVALDSLPADTQAAGFTDWSGVRRELGLGSAATKAARAALTDDALLRDLSTRSVLGQSTEEMHTSYGWSVADLDWEAYGQAPGGAAMVGRLDGSVTFAAIRARLKALGYVHRGRVWSGTGNGTIAADLGTALAAIVLVPGRRIVIASADPAYASAVLRVVEHRTSSLLGVRSAAEVAGRLVGADSALLQTGAATCRATSLASADADVRRQGRAAVQRAGGLTRPAFSGRALVASRSPGEEMRFALAFGSPGVAARQLAVRTSLTTGPLIGRGGRIEDALTLRGASVHGATATFRFRHERGDATYMTGDGPLLFAGC